MDLGTFTQSCASAYRDIGEANGWRKGRNSPRGYDNLTMPSSTWDDRPHERYLLVVNHHLSSAAAQVDACGSCYSSGNGSAVVTLARAVFVESSKASWLLEENVAWTQRAARAHLELLVNLDGHVRRLPKRLESGYPSFRRRQWKAYREQLRDDVIDKLFGSRALSQKREDTTLVGETLLTSTQLERDFADLLSINGFDAVGGVCVAAPDALIDPSVSIAVPLNSPLVVDDRVVAQSLVIAVEAWLGALEAWVRYNAWEMGVVDRLGHQLQRLLRPAP